jgi:hypothetical protein
LQIKGTATWAWPAVAWDGAPQPVIRPPILLGVHHKTGSKWMLAAFGSLPDMIRRTGRAFHFSYHSKFNDDLLSTDFLGMHLIRDPRDVVLSGMHYHKKADEKWLHRTQTRLGGLTYQQKLNALASEDEQFIFELENRGRMTVDGMTAWRYGDPRVFEARYEELIADVTGEMFAGILRFLQLDEEMVGVGVSHFMRSTLFPGRPIPSNHPHIRSGQREQWRSAFRRWHGERFVEVLGDSLIKLGYERNHDWVTRLPV